jgi:ABC-type antimicrobial peptide transport system permease subunit
MPITIEGRHDLEGASTEYRVVSPGYLETMGIEVRSGRSIGETDRRGAEPVVVINEALADAWFSGIDPIGMRLGEGSDGRLTRIIGVVGNAAERTLTDPAVPVRYVALAQMSWVDEPQSLVFSTAPGIDLVRLLDQARQRIVEVAPAVPVRQTTTASRMLDEAVGPVRQVLSLLSLVTGIALTLGAIGVYGVMLHFAGRRRREWAIRMALGSPRSAAVARVMSHGGRLVGLGIVLGFLLALVLARLLSSFLYGVHQLDPASFAGVAIVLASTGLLASFLPARSASATEPAAVLREDG